MQERLRVLMLYHLCSLLLMCLELVVGFIKAPATTAAIQTIVKQRAGADFCTLNIFQHSTHLKAIQLATSQGCQELEMLQKLYHRKELLPEPWNSCECTMVKWDHRDIFCAFKLKLCLEGKWTATRIRWCPQVNRTCFIHSSFWNPRSCLLFPTFTLIINYPKSVNFSKQGATLREIRVRSRCQL